MSSVGIQFKKCVSDINAKLRSFSNILDKDINLLQIGKREEFIKKLINSEYKYINDMNYIEDIHQNILKYLHKDSDLKISFGNEINGIYFAYKSVNNKLKLAFSYIEAYIKNNDVLIEVIKKCMLDSIKLHIPYDENGKLLSDHEIKNKMDAIYLKEWY